LQKENGTKGTRKLLVKLTKAANFTNISLAAFFYESILRCFSVVTVWVCNFLLKENVTKGTFKMLVKSTKSANWTSIL